ncbi:MAG: ABC transporter permease [Candidatus Dormibacteraeota bacterium]|nr:ABC transporter permease [Candidatus Dormibacteraeota bacterium]
MSWRDSVRLAFRSLVRRPARTALTILAVTLGTGLLMALGTIAGTADTRVISQLSKGGPAAAIKVAAAEPDPTQLASDNLRTGKAKNMTQEAVNAIQRAPHVASVVPILATRVVAIPPPRGKASVPPTESVERQTRPPDPIFETMVGADLSRVRQLPITVLAGRLPAAASLTEVAVTQGYLDRLHLDVNKPSVVVGSEIEFADPQFNSQDPVPYRGRWFRATVVGVVAQEVADGQFLVPIQQTQVARAWALQGEGDGGDLPLPTSAYTGLVVVATSLDEVHTVRGEITVLGYATSAPEHLVASVQKYLHVVDIVLGGIGTIALVIACLGIANALLAAVRERRREIGVLKAIGARDRDVLRWFLSEAFGVGAVGGLLGTILGLAIAEVVGLIVNGYLIAQGLEGVQLGDFSVVFLAAGITGTIALALIAGVVPALQAARLPARDAVGGA